MIRLRTIDADSFPIAGGCPYPKRGFSDRFWIGLRSSLAALGIRTKDAEQVEKELRGVAAMQTGDELLEPMTSGTTISLGKTYGATTSASPEVHELLGPIRDFVRGFVPGNIVDALSPGTVIDLARQYNASTQEDEKREARGRAIDAAEEAWQKRVPGTAPSDLVAKTFTPGMDGKRGAKDVMQLGEEVIDASSVSRRSKDSLTRVARSGGRLLAGVRSNMFSAARTADYAQKLEAGRKAPSIVGATPAADYARTMAAARAKLDKA